jgi:uncharacterized membrane protein YccC
MHRDRGLALLSAAAAAISTLSACLFWIAGSWPEGAVAAEFAAIGCSLFATLDRPSEVIFSAIIGILVALPLAALYQFAIIPRIDGFAALALALLPPILLFSWMITKARLENAAIVLALAFAGGLALQSTYQPDFAAFINVYTAEIVGLLMAAVTNLVFRTFDPLWNARRISRAGWRSLTTLVRGRNIDLNQWVLEMFDRLGLVTSRLLFVRRTGLIGPHLNVLRDIRVGINVNHLETLSHQLSSAVQSTTAPVFRAIRQIYQRQIRGNFASDSRCIDAIDASIEALAREPAAPTNRVALRALVGLRLDLALIGTRYRLHSATS